MLTNNKPDYKIDTCSGSNAGKTSDHALNGSDDRRFAKENDIERGPHEEARGGGEVGVEHSD